MDIFERLLKFFGRDYWRMSDEELLKLAIKYHINGFKTVSLKYFEEDLLFRRDFPAKRESIIKQLVNRDKFVRSFVAVLISIIALLVAIFK